MNDRDLLIASIIVFICLFLLMFLGLEIRFDKIDKQLSNKADRICYNESVYHTEVIDFSGGIVRHFACNGFRDEFGKDNYTEQWRKHYFNFPERMCTEEICYVYNTNCGMVAIIERGENDSFIVGQVYAGEKEVCEIK